MKKRPSWKRWSQKFHNEERVLIKLKSDQLWLQSSKNQWLMRKCYEPVEIIHKVGKTSYKIQLLPWMRTSQVVHVSNLKCYYPNQEDTKRKEVVRPHTTKKNFTAKKVEETLTMKTWRLLNAEISWKCIRDLKLASSYITEFVKSQLTEMSTNWVREDVMIMLV